MSDYRLTQYSLAAVPVELFANGTRWKADDPNHSLAMLYKGNKPGSALSVGEKFPNVVRNLGGWN
jgi:hypothetical protein